VLEYLVAVNEPYSVAIYFGLETLSNSDFVVRVKELTGPWS
jgi:hypothetical protein